MPLSSNSPKPSPSPNRPLTERVQERVDTVAARLTAHQRHERRRTTFTEAQGGDSPLELRALRRVFHDMGRQQRSARRQTGQAPSHIVRQAALAFRQNPSLPALILVAASLDEVGLLLW
jgi:hypothetical protein